VKTALLLAAIALTPAIGSAAGPTDTPITIRNARGMVVRLIPQGAIVTAIEVPDRDGRMADVVLGYPKPSDYRTKVRKNGFGATIGRFAGRIANARFAIDGQTVRLVPNDGVNALHGGGVENLSTVDWTVTGPAAQDRATFTLVSPDGFQGFPGRLTVTVAYRVMPDDALRIDYTAHTTRPTAINLTNHSYFNLAGEGSGSVEHQLLQIKATRYVATREGGIPTGALPPVSGTPLDFRCPRAIGAQIDSKAPVMGTRGYNHAWLFDKRAGTLAPVARLIDPVSGRTLTVETTEPSVQVYTGGYIDGTDAGPSGHVYRPRDGIALESQHLPDSPNQPRFPSTILRPGQVYHQTTIWRFGVDGTATPACR
jgi:aldose 1-epimerase